MPQTVFLLSPASSSGRRAALLLRESAAFPLAERVRSREGVPLGEVFSFLSGLYFRGKLAYARAFGSSVRGPAALVIAPGLGLADADLPVRYEDLVNMAAVPIDPGEPRYRLPLERDARALARTLAEADEVVLLGSIATDKYTGPLSPILPDLRFPGDFVGRGDMSRGGLMLRCAREGRRLETLPVAGATLRGARPPRLAPIRPHRTPRTAPVPS